MRGWLIGRESWLRSRQKHLKFEAAVTCGSDLGGGWHSDTPQHHRRATGLLCAKQKIGNQGGDQCTQQTDFGTRFGLWWR
jgi:hypothetical protein